jgi:ferritin-like metal-binding protein YciE
MPKEITARDAKLVQYLNEAYGKERQLETALQAHIAMTTRAAYKKRLQEHLRETKRHAKEVERRIKKLGGTAEGVTVPGPEPVAGAAQRVQSVANKAAALAQGPLHMVRGTGEAEKLLKNAKTEYADEAEEIATYTAIETLAVEVGDRETQQLARAIRREEERMRKFLERLIPQLTKAVAKDEIPPAERNGGKRRRRRAPTRSRSSAANRSTGRSRSTSRSASSARKAPARGKSSGRSRASTSRSRGRGRSSR